MNTVKQEVKKVETIKLLEMEKKKEVATEVTKDATKALIEKFKVKQPTAEERINRIQHFEAISKRFTQLKEKSNDLKMFDAGNDQTNSKIVLKNSSNFEFSVTNTNVIKKVRDAMENELNILLNDAENEILTFEI